MHLKAEEPLFVSEDGNVIVGGATSVKLWRFHDGRSLFSDKGHRAPVRHMRLVCIDRLISVDAIGTLVFWDVVNATELGSFQAGKTCAISEDGRDLAFVKGQRVLIVSNVLGDPREKELQYKKVISLAISRRLGSVAIGNSEGDVFLVRYDGSKKVTAKFRPPNGVDGLPTRLLFSPSSNRLCIVYQQAVVVFDIKTTQLVYDFSFPEFISSVHWETEDSVAVIGWLLMSRVCLRDKRILGGTRFESKITASVREKNSLFYVCLENGAIIKYDAAADVKVAIGRTSIAATSVVLSPWAILVATNDCSILALPRSVSR